MNLMILLLEMVLLVDGSGGPSFKGDIAINADTIVAVGDLKNAAGSMEIDATGTYRCSRVYKYAKLGQCFPD